MSSNEEESRDRMQYNTSSQETVGSSEGEDSPSGTSFNVRQDSKRKQKETSPQSESPSKKYEFNYFQEKKARKSLNYLKIEDLSPKSAVLGKLRARISYMSTLEKTKTQKIDTIHLTLFDGVQDISAVVYGGTAIRLAGKLKVNQVIDICGFKVVKCSWHPLHTLEIKISESSVIELVGDVRFPNLDFHFVTPHANVYEISDGERADIIGVLGQDWGLQVVGKDVIRYQKRDISLIDGDDPNSRNLVVTFWGKVAVDFKAEVGSVVVIRKGYVERYQNQKKLSIQNSLVLVNPDWPSISDDVKKIKLWFEKEDSKDEDG